MYVSFLVLGEDSAQGCVVCQEGKGGGVTREGDVRMGGEDEAEETHRDLI